jgi:hypothetical protein
VFLEASRYYKQKVVSVARKGRKALSALTLRRLPPTTGKPTRVSNDDRLDIMAQRQFKDPTRFWHIADANTELEAGNLIAEAGRTIEVPEQ